MKTIFLQLSFCFLIASTLLATKVSAQTSNFDIQITNLKFIDSAQLGVVYHFSFDISNKGTDSVSFPNGLLTMNAYFDSSQQTTFNYSLTPKVTDTFHLAKLHAGDSIHITGGAGVNILPMLCRQGGENEIIIWPEPIHGEPDSLNNSCTTIFYLGKKNAGVSDFSSTKNNNKILIFPNPTNDELNIQTNLEQLNAIEIDNILGEIVFKQFIINSQHQKTFNINVADWQKGIYFLKMICADKTTITRLVKE